MEEELENVKEAQELSKTIAENEGEVVQGSIEIGVCPTRLTNEVLS